MFVPFEELNYQYHCLHYYLTTNRRHHRQRVLVNGSPKTGTTWMLNMIASIPGYHSVGNFDREIERYAHVVPGEVVHGHDWYRGRIIELIDELQIKVILMIRDPRDQLISRMYHIRRSHRHEWHDRFQELKNFDALMLCIDGHEDLPGIKTMVNLNNTWLDSPAPILCIHYEDLLADPQKNFQRVLEYLNIKNDGLAEAIVQRNRFERQSVGWRIWRVKRKPGDEDVSSHLRKGISGDWKNHLEEAHRQRIKELIGPDLITYGYEQDLNW